MQAPPFLSVAHRLLNHTKTHASSPPLTPRAAPPPPPPTKPSAHLREPHHRVKGPLGAEHLLQVRDRPFPPRVEPPVAVLVLLGVPPAGQVEKQQTAYIACAPLILLGGRLIECGNAQ